MTIHKSETEWVGVAGGHKHTIKTEKEIVWQIDLSPFGGKEQSVRIVRVKTKEKESSNWSTIEFVVELASRDVLGELFWRPADPMPEWVIALIINHIG